MKVLVTGGRDYGNTIKVFETLNAIKPTQLCQGGANGADQLARAWAITHDIPYVTCEADWSQGRKAGPLRNQKMLDEFKPDLVIAFPGGRGTADMVRRAKAAGVEVREVE